MSGETTIPLPLCVPRATYRLQFHRGFTLRRAIELVPYLHDLGVSHVYASPLLKACPGSTHGYDVCDHSQINPEIGTEQELEELARTLHRHEMGLVLDIVPNHMAICGRHNVWWWDVLRHGRNSQFADYFDIDWEAPDTQLCGKVLLPVLGDDYGRTLDRGELKLVYEDDETLLAYHEHRFPIAPNTLILPSESLSDTLARLNTDFSALDAVIQRQHYLLADWRHGNAALNYRRFFDISSLAGIRVEDPRVFQATHALSLRWYADGWIDGFRVDHPDGLQDPKVYFERLRSAAPRSWIVAEKILQPGESVAGDWPVAGTTGYEFIRHVTGLFVDPASEKRLTGIYAEFTGEPTDYGVVLREKQHLVLRDLFEAEVNWLTRLLVRAAAHYPRYREIDEDALRGVLIEVATCLPVYRTYVQARIGRVPEADVALISDTITWTREHQPQLPPEAIDFVGDLLLLRIRGETEQEFVTRFQQLTGPTMAKGAEDTACYCFNRLIALNTVGGDPSRFAVSPGIFHEQCARSLRHWPNSMLTTSTHDTKRSGDVRTRICLLSEIPEQWSAAVLQWSAMNEKHRRGNLPDRNMEYFYYQTLVGAWPLPLDRALAVMEKSSREAKQHTSWTRPTGAYDAALREFVTGSLGDADFVSALERFVAPLVEAGQINSLSQLLLKLTCPGVPDIYQGSELWDLSLVDPDNRRSVDFETRQRLLAELRTLSVEQMWQRRHEGLTKLWLMQKTLQLRRRHPTLFDAEGSYAPLRAHGAKAAHVVAFTRAGCVVTIVPRLVLRVGGDWVNTKLHLPEGGWLNEFTGERFGGGERLVGELLRQFPVALLSAKED
jgi:(1->4)-alpha-D-glucan 1-alpha-D-glucosylmutase